MVFWPYVCVCVCVYQYLQTLLQTQHVGFFTLLEVTHRTAQVPRSLSWCLISGTASGPCIKRWRTPRRAAKSGAGFIIMHHYNNSDVGMTYETSFRMGKRRRLMRRSHTSFVAKISSSFHLRCFQRNPRGDKIALYNLMSELENTAGHMS